jgi:hypothetical protein
MTDTLLDMPTEKKTPDTENARISREIMRKARVVAPRLDMTVPEYLASRLGPLVAEDYTKALAEMVKEEKASKRKPD